MTAVDWSAILPPWLPEALPAGILVTDAELIIRHWCRWLEGHSGIPAAALVGRPLLEIFPELRERGLERCFRRALAGERVSLPEREHGYLLPLRPSIDCPSHAHMAQHAQVCPLEADGRVIGTVSTIIDRTAQAALEAARAAQAAAEERLRQRDRYLSLAAHELRTPLTALLGRAQLLQRWLSEGADERTTRSVAIVVEQARRLNAMISTVLEMSRAQSGRLSIAAQQLDLADLVRGAVEEQRGAAGARIVTEITAGPLPVLVDKARMEQVLRSMLDNAVKFSPRGGAIRVRAEGRAGEALITVSDEGIGIPPGEQRQLFECNFRGSNAERLGIKGLGAELFVAGRIVALHGGSISVESAEDRGSSFTLRLPLLSL